MKKTNYMILIAVFFTAVVSASPLDREKENYKSADYLKKNTFAIKDNYVFFADSARIIKSLKGAQMAARHRAINQIYRLKLLEINAEGFTPQLKSSFKSKLFLQYQAVTSLKVSTEKMITIASYRQNGYYFFAGACKMSDIKFTPEEKLSLPNIYKVLKNSPTKRNELIFYEIIPAHELSASKDAVENKIAKQFGKNFSLMFAGKEIKTGTKKEYEAIEKSFPELSGSSLQSLIAISNKLPYNKRICTLLAEKFTDLEMPRCAGIMKERAEQSDKLIFAPEIPVQKKTEVNSVPASSDSKPDAPKKSLPVKKSIKNKNEAVGKAKAASSAKSPKKQTEQKAVQLP